MSTQKAQKRRKVSILDIQKKKDNGQPITMLTAYDYSSGRLVDGAGVDIILVGDSLGMVMLGLDSTVPVTMAEMIHHARAVSRGAKSAFLIGDMPFMSFQADVAEAVRNAGRFLKEAGMDAIKLEGGQAVVPTIQAITAATIPVMGHIGLTPQSVAMLGGHRVQGKTAAAARRLLDDALALEAAGCFAIVLEAVPSEVAAAITARLSIPTIGIGAGRGCSGQVLVYHDMIGLFEDFQPKFVKRYAQVGQVIQQALSEYVTEVSAGQFPGDEHTYPISEAELADFLRELND